MRFVLSTRVQLAVALLLAAALLWVSNARLRPITAQAKPQADAPELDIPPFPAEVLRPLSFGFASVIADVLFLEAVQIVGDRSFAAKLPAGSPMDRRLARLLDYATQLDPQFRGAYRFAGNAMPRQTPNGVIANVFETAQILERGVRERPDDWKISFELGYLQAFYLDETAQAAKTLAISARVPEAPSYLAFLATRLAAEGGELDYAEQMARTMLENATEDSTRAEWQRRLQDIAMERDLRAMDDAVRRFRAAHGRPPASLDELVAAGDLRSIPKEPHGGAWKIGPGGEPGSTAAPRLRQFHKGLK